MKKIKVITVITNRASYGRLKPFLLELEDSEFFENIIISTASMNIYRFGNAVSILKNDGYRDIRILSNSIEGDNQQNASKVTALMMIELSTIFNHEKPNYVISFADRYETLATSVAATYQKIPLVHIQGGEISGNIDDRVRNANSKLADIHFVTTEKSRLRLLNMLEDPDYVFNVGCTCVETINNIKFDKEHICKELKDSGLGKLNPDEKYILVLQHPETTAKIEPREQIKATIDAINDVKLKKVVLWPNIDSGTDEFSKYLREECMNKDDFFMIRNVPVNEYMQLMQFSEYMVGNSSSLIREAAILGKRSILVGSRQKNREHDKNVIFCDYDSEQIRNTINGLTFDNINKSKRYGNGDSSKKMIKTLIDKYTNDFSFKKTILNYKND